MKIALALVKQAIFSNFQIRVATVTRKVYNLVGGRASPLFFKVLKTTFLKKVTTPDQYKDPNPGVKPGRRPARCIEPRRVVAKITRD